MKDNAALNDDFRDIPVPTINNEILIKSGLRAKEHGAQIKISQKDVEDLLNAPEVQKANIHHLSTEEYANKIRSYIESHKGHWRDIVTKIEVFYPLSERMRGIEIIDSPGICARGGVSEITDKYIKNADAVIFLKPLTGQALVASQFNDFMEEAGRMRNKNALFLVLTRAADLPPASLRSLAQEAYSVFELPQDHIFLVDSKAELYAKTLAPVSDIKAELCKMNDAGTLDGFVKNTYFETTTDIFGDGNSDFIRALHEKSGFEQVNNALELFGRSAHFILLGALLDSICRLYTKLEKDLEVKADAYRQKAEDPAELAKKIAVTKQALDELQDKLAKGVDEISHRFRGDGGIILSTANAAEADFIEQAGQIDPKSDSSFRELKRLSLQKIDQFNDLMSELQQQAVSEFDKQLTKLSDKCTFPPELLQPDFTEKTFDEIRSGLEPLAKDKEHDEFLTFKLSSTHSVYSQHKHFRLVKDSIMERIRVIKNKMITAAGRFVQNISKEYIKELSSNVDIKKGDLTAIHEAKVTAEQIALIISKLEELRRRIGDARAAAMRLKGGIEKNVQ